MLLSVGLYKLPTIMGFFKSLLLKKEAATISALVCRSISDASRSCLAKMATPPWLPSIYLFVAFQV